MKNKFILGLILGIFLIGLVSAGITGYLAQRQSISDSEITATLQKVYGDGTVAVAVTDTTGAIETVTAVAGETVTTSTGVQIEVGAVRRGLFKRGAEISVTPSEEKVKCGVNSYSLNGELCGNELYRGAFVECYDGSTQNMGDPTSCKSPTQWENYAKQFCEGKCSKVQDSHTHLSDVYTPEITFYLDSDKIKEALDGNGNIVYIPDYLAGGPGKGTLQIYDMKWYDEVSSTYKVTKVKQLALKVHCDKYTEFDLAVGGKYSLGLDYADGVEYQIIAEGVTNKVSGLSPKVGEYSLTIQEPFIDINGDLIDDEGIEKVVLQVTCARIEPTLHQFSLD